MLDSSFGWRASIRACEEYSMVVEYVQIHFLVDYAGNEMPLNRQRGIAMKRRDFLSYGVILAAGLWLATKAQARVKPKPRKSPSRLPEDVYLDQSGAYGEDTFVVGLLTCADPIAAHSDCAMLRERTGFRCALSYASRNRWKCRYAKRLIDSWLNGSNLRIEVLVFNNPGKSKPEDPDAALTFKADTMARLLSRLPDSASKRRLVTQRHYPGLLQDRYEAWLQAHTKRIDSVLRINSAQSDLLQLLDFVVGSVRASQEHVARLAENRVKRDLLVYLNDKLPAPGLRGKLNTPRCAIDFA
jgi:hypothetical protein